MSIDPIIITDATDSTIGPIIGPLRVAPHLYVDGLNGTISDPSHLRVTEKFVAFKDSAGPGQVCFSKYSPYWTKTGSGYFDGIQLWNANRSICTAAKPVLFPGSGAGQRIIEGYVDGNGYFYMVGSTFALASGGTSTGNRYEALLARIERDGTIDTATIDFRAIAPGPNDWTGVAYDPYDSDTGIAFDVRGTLPQENGLLIRADIGIDRGLSTPPNSFIYAYLDTDLNVVSSWFPPYDGAIRVDPVVSNIPFGIAKTPLPEGYIGISGGTVPKFYRVNQSGGIDSTVAIPYSGFPSISAFDFGRIYFDSDGGFWLRSFGTPGTLKYIKSDLTEGTPGWADNLTMGTPLVSSAPFSSGSFRFICDQFDASLGSAGDTVYRIRDNTGTVLVEKQVTDNSSGEPLLSRRHYGCFGTGGVQQSVDNCYLFANSTLDSGLTGVYKFAADNLVSSQVGGGGPDIWSRGQFAHFSYADWPVDEGVPP